MVDQNVIMLYHGGAEPVANPEIRITKYTKDFGFGFYCTRMEHQAKRWCHRKSKIGFHTDLALTSLDYISHEEVKRDG